MGMHHDSTEMINTNIKEVKLGLVPLQKNAAIFDYLKISGNDLAGYEPEKCALVSVIQFNSTPLDPRNYMNTDFINMFGMHPDGIETGTAAVMNGYDFETIQFADINMLKHGELEAAPDFWTNLQPVTVPGNWSAPTGLGDEWGQTYDEEKMQWTVWNYCNAGKVNKWTSGLWHAHIF